MFCKTGVSHKFLGKIQILGCNGPDGELQGVGFDRFFQQVVYIGSQTHINHIITGIAADYDGVFMGCGVPLFDGVQEIEPAQATQKYINYKDCDADIPFQAKGYRFVGIREIIHVAPGVKALN